MGHHLHAIVGKNPINLEKIKSYQLAVAFEDDFVIIILEIESLCYWAEKLNLSTESESDNLDWACELVFYLASELGLQKYALVQTDYFGGMGEQFAALCENGKMITKEKKINEILENLGVKRKFNMDEFDSINLGEYRGTEEYYWDTMNAASTKSNMIEGRIPKN